MTQKERFLDTCRKAAAEGAVLLKNEDRILPLHGEVAVFGRIQINYYRSGTGSGGSVNVDHAWSLLEALRTKTQIHLNENLAATYEAWVEEHPFNGGDGTWASEPWFQEEMPVEKTLACDAAKGSDTAVVVIGRTAGEDKDNVLKEGSYLLTKTEQGMLMSVTEAFDRVVLLLNIPNPIDFSFIQNLPHADHIRAILISWQGGQIGALAAADVLCGDVNPSGHLTDTIARRIEDYPANDHFGDRETVLYTEDIYVGYRYFETFAPDAVLYPFGFGLSYTTFSISRVRGHRMGDQIRVSCRVTNTGNVSGKEVVQLYGSAPQGKLGRPRLELQGFAKTSLLAPGAHEDVELTLDLTAMAAFDDSGVSGYRNAWVLEAGEYQFYLGVNVRQTMPVLVDDARSISLADTRLVEQLEEALAPVKPFERLRPKQTAAPEQGLRLPFDKSYEAVPLRRRDLGRAIQESLPKALAGKKPEHRILLGDVRDGRADMDAFIAQLSRRDLCAIVRGEGMCSPKVTPGTASAFGGVSDALLDLGIPVGCCSDGPSGIRQDTGDIATQMPIGTLLACTWNPALVERLYACEGAEMKSKHIDILLGPGMNIHRHPLNGRNFEYFSEDPLMTGIMACANVIGVRKGGAKCTIKHFACNNQETARYNSDSVVSQRALREIYLKGFEMAVKIGGADCLMTAYNQLNGVHTSSNYELTTTILREQWGYQGLVMTDWYALTNDCLSGGEETRNNTAAMVRSQNDVYMVVPNHGAEVNTLQDNSEAALADGTLTIGELQRSAANICRVLMTCGCMDRPLYQGNEVLTADPMEVPSDGAGAAFENGDGVISFDADFESGNLVRITEEGIYELAVDASFLGAETAQSSVQIRINGADAVMFTMSGNPVLPDATLKVGRFDLKPGYYRISYEIRKTGLTLKRLHLIHG